MKLIYLDTCQPDYFQGFGGTTLIAFHHKGQTIREMIEDLNRNANNESHDSEVYEALKDYSDRWLNSPDAEKPCINEAYTEPDKDGDTGLVHYFGLVESED